MTRCVNARVGREVFGGTLGGLLAQLSANLGQNLLYMADFKDGRLIRYADYFDHRQALEAAGISE